MPKTMCKASKEKVKERKNKSQIFTCEKCKCTASKEKHLCKPIKIKS